MTWMGYFGAAGSKACLGCETSCDCHPPEPGSKVSITSSVERLETPEAARRAANLLNGLPQPEHRRRTKGQHALKPVSDSPPAARRPMSQPDRADAGLSRTDDVAGGSPKRAKATVSAQGHFKNGPADREAGDGRLLVPQRARVKALPDPKAREPRPPRGPKPPPPRDPKTPPPRTPPKPGPIDQPDYPWRPRPRSRRRVKPRQTSRWTLGDLSFWVSAHRGSIYGDGSRKRPFRYIQDAIDAAREVYIERYGPDAPGGGGAVIRPIVNVLPGIYDEELVIDIPIALRGTRTILSRAAVTEAERYEVESWSGLENDRWHVSQPELDPRQAKSTTILTTTRAVRSTVPRSLIGGGFMDGPALVRIFGEPSRYWSTPVEIEGFVLDCRDKVRALRCVDADVRVSGVKIWNPAVFGLVLVDSRFSLERSEITTRSPAQTTTPQQSGVAALRSFGRLRDVVVGPDFETAAEFSIPQASVEVERCTIRGGSTWRAKGISTLAGAEQSDPARATLSGARLVVEDSMIIRPPQWPVFHPWFLWEFNERGRPMNASAQAAEVPVALMEDNGQLAGQTNAGGAPPAGILSRMKLEIRDTTVSGFDAGLHCQDDVSASNCHFVGNATADVFSNLGVNSRECDFGGGPTGSSLGGNSFAPSAVFAIVQAGIFPVYAIGDNWGTPAGANPRVWIQRRILVVDNENAPGLGFVVTDPADAGLPPEVFWCRRGASGGSIRVEGREFPCDAGRREQP